jgi:hypothetical protein
MEIIIALIALSISVISLVMSFFSFYQQKRQNDNFVRELRVNANKDINDSHRDLFFEVLKDQDFIARVAPNPNAIEQFKTEMLGTILINHCEQIFRTAKNNLFSSDDWVGLQNDIEDFFNWNVVKTRWQSNRRFYSEDFQNFVDNMTIRGRRTNIQDEKL